VFILTKPSSTCTVWVSDPTWPNHIPLLGGAGLQLKTYSYYDPTTKSLDFATMMSQLEQSKPGDVLLLHGCCHNPSGADLTLEQWQTVTEFVTDRELMPFVDVAYQGLGEGIDEDAAGWRHLAARVPEMLMASSCSKNFGLYRERTGALVAIARDEDSAQNLQSQSLSAARQIYSMPPSYGGAVGWHHPRKL